MSCGSPLGDLFYLADTLLYHSRPSVLSPLAPVGAGDDLRAQLYNLYGEGRITEEVFAALRALADRGQLRPADLAVHRAQAQRRPTGRGSVDAPSVGNAAAITNALRGLRSRLTQLAQARAASEQVLADLEARLAGLEDRMADKEQAARESIERDEQEARSRLAEKAELAASRSRLAAQAEALRADLARLADLRAQLEDKAAELEAVQARSRLAEEVLQ